MYQTILENGSVETFGSKAEVEAVVTVTAEQWRSVDAGRPVQLDTFLGKATLRRC